MTDTVCGDLLEDGTVVRCHGIMLGGYDMATLPDGAVPVQRHDECGQFDSDEDAAVFAMERFGGTCWGFAYADSDRAFTGEGGDYWIIPKEAFPWLS